MARMNTRNLNPIAHKTSDEKKPNVKNPTMLSNMEGDDTHYGLYVKYFFSTRYWTRSARGRFIRFFTVSDSVRANEGLRFASRMPPAAPRRGGVRGELSRERRFRGRFGTATLARGFPQPISKAESTCRRREGDGCNGDASTQTFSSKGKFHLLQFQIPIMIEVHILIEVEDVTDRFLLRYPMRFAPDFAFPEVDVRNPFTLSR